MKLFTPSSKNILLYLTFLLGNSRTMHNQLPTITGNFEYDPTNLLQADNFIIIASS